LSDSSIKEEKKEEEENRIKMGVIFLFQIVTFMLTLECLHGSSSPTNQGMCTIFEMKKKMIKIQFEIKIKIKRKFKLIMHG
jgi:hypothetical protein